MRKINVILGRGLLGRRYSQGMDVLGAKVAKLPGVDFVTVEDYTSWRSIRDRIARFRDPTVIGGHSFFANAATIITESLIDEVEFPLIITVDPSPYWSWSLWQSGPSAVSKNVIRAVNFYQTGGLIGRQQLYRPGGGQAGIVNIAVESTHTEIDDMPLVHDRIVEEIKKVIAS